METLEQAQRIRAVEEWFLEHAKAGDLPGTTHTCIGQEMSALALGHAVAEEDVIFSNHRNHGHFLACGGELDDLMAQVMALPASTTKGVGGSQYVTKPGRFYSTAIQGGLVPVAAGVALHCKREQRPAIAVVCIGDGTLGQGVVWETASLAALWGLPLLFFVEMNGYAQSTPTPEEIVGSVAARFRAFGVETWEANTWRYPALFSQAEHVAGVVRRQRKPCALIVETYRLGPHSRGWDDRNSGEVRLYGGLDPLVKVPAAAVTRSKHAVRIAWEKARAKMPVEAPKTPATAFEPPGSIDSLKGIVSVRAGLLECLRMGAVVLGEDIRDPGGGAFKATRGLTKDWDEQIYNTPISEAAITGVGVGLALMGTPTLVEIMFGDFTLLAADQLINSAAKLRTVCGADLPLIVRAPMGGGRGYGPSHSQSMEQHFIGVPGLTVACLHHRTTAAEVYRRALHSKCPTLVVESKRLYDVAVGERAPPSGYTVEVTGDCWPITSLVPEGRSAQVSVIALGGASIAAENAVRELAGEGIFCRLDLPTLLWGRRGYANIYFPASSFACRACVVAEEGTGFGSAGTELTAWIAGQGVKCIHMHSAWVPIPANREAEDRTLVSTSSIVGAVKSLLTWE